MRLGQEATGALQAFFAIFELTLFSVACAVDCAEDENTTWTTVWSESGNHGHEWASAEAVAMSSSDDYGCLRFLSQVSKWVMWLCGRVRA